MKNTVRVIGAGLAGSEAAWQIVSAGIPVILYEMRPLVMTKAHQTGEMAELVCSNSFRGTELTQAVGLLKEELRCLNSLIIKAADESRVPAGGALAVDRKLFSQYIDQTLRSHPLVRVIPGEITDIPEADSESPVIIATGPLTSKSLTSKIAALTGAENLAFFDAISPIILGSSIDRSKIFRASRYGKGEGDDYLNIPLNESEYLSFIAAVGAAEKFGGHDEVESDSLENLRPFEGCMPIEEMISRGADTLRFGPMKPVGLTDPNTGRRPFAVLQLRQDDKAGHLWSMVGFQTRMKHGEQMRIFCSLPGLSKAEFVRLGSVHRNTFINSPNCLNATNEFRGKPGLFFAGQITGVEGYVESTASGLVAGLNAVRSVLGLDRHAFSEETAIGALLHYISSQTRSDFQPMNVSFGLMPSYLNEISKKKKKDKANHRLNVSLRALEKIRDFVSLNTSSEKLYANE